ncbi:MAG: sigma-70 family RNA polymerase sigma factor, partial [Bacilli bacterium]|nr:sigma-70 family RNA polymerase sigma factor [Bacilli bacterium]
MNIDLKIYIDSIRKYSPLPKDEIYDLGIRKNLGDAEARQKLINHHLLYVVSIAKNYFIRYPNVDPLDIIQYGNEGLIKAVDKYNPEYAALTTYSKDWIEETIERMLGITQSDLTTPVDVQFKARKYKAIMKKTLYNNETPPSDEELLEILKVSENGLNRIKEYANTTFVSMNKVVNDYDGNHDTELSDFIADKNVKNPEDTINKVDDFELLITLKENLSPLHYYILYMRLLDNKPHSYRDLGEKIGVEHTYIGVLEAAAKKAAAPFLEGDKEKMRKEVARIKLREKANFYKLNTKPLKPKDIIDYLYLK